MIPQVSSKIFGTSLGSLDSACEEHKVLKAANNVRRRILSGRLTYLFDDYSTKAVSHEDQRQTLKVVLVMLTLRLIYLLQDGVFYAQ